MCEFQKAGQLLKNLEKCLDLSNDLAFLSLRLALSWRNLPKGSKHPWAVFINDVTQFFNIFGIFIPPYFTVLST